MISTKVVQRYAWGGHGGRDGCARGYMFAEPQQNAILRWIFGWEQEHTEKHDAFRLQTTDLNKPIR